MTGVPPVPVRHAVADGSIGPFTRLRTQLQPSVSRGDRPGGEEGALLLKLVVPAADVLVEWLHPFSWDAGDRGVRTCTRRLAENEQVCLHAGPYGTADAVAHAHGVPMRFPADGDGHRYLAGDPPGPDDEHQDTAAWVLVQVTDPDHPERTRTVVVAWEYSGHLVTTVLLAGGLLQVRALLPADTFAPDPEGSLVDTPGPVGWLAVVEGDLDAAATVFRALVGEEMVRAPDLSGLPGEPVFPCVVANSWGVGEDTSTERVRAMMDASAAVGAEVFVVDKGWERSVGDWHAADRFPGGLPALSAYARELGMGFGVWCGFGNADPASPVAQEHPDWIARWRGDTARLSFDNLALCLGHDPVRDWVLGELTRMVSDFGLTWLLHDFESIARCDRGDHTHDPGAGEHAAEAAWHHVLRSLAGHFPQLVLENCWNGSRPLDLAMVRSHHTTITEDHCRVHENSLAKVGLGRYLPLDWQSAYMGAEDLPPRARIAPYVIGGPWILMDDLAAWSEETRHTLQQAVAVYKRWRRRLVRAAVRRPVIRGGAGPALDLDAVQADLDPATALVAVSVPPGHRDLSLELGLADGSWSVTDEWTGRSVAVAVVAGTLRWPVKEGWPMEQEGDGLLLSLHREPL